MSKMNYVKTDRNQTIEISPNRYGCAHDMLEQIKRHVDHVGYSNISTDGYWEVDGEHFDTMQEALIFETGNEDVDYSDLKLEYRYERPQDNGVGSRGSCYSFLDLLKEMNQKPWDFQLISGELTPKQVKIFDAVSTHLKIKLAKALAK